MATKIVKDRKEHNISFNTLCIEEQFPLPINLQFAFSIRNDRFHVSLCHQKRVLFVQVCSDEFWEISLCDDFLEDASGSHQMAPVDVAGETVVDGEKHLLEKVSYELTNKTPGDNCRRARVF